MKGIDTPVLLAILEGGTAAKTLLHRLRGVEVATTEANMLELTLIASRGPPRARVSRLRALDRLRRRVTVLPIDSGAVGAAASHLSKGENPLGPTAMAGAFDRAGCDEVYVSESFPLSGKWRFHVIKFSSQSGKPRASRTPRSERGPAARRRESDKSRTINQ